MNKEKITNILFYIIIALLISFLMYYCIGVAYSSRSKIIKENDEYLWVRKYDIYNRDSAVYKYHQPIEYLGVVTKKWSNSGYVGVPGKGGHPVRNYHIKIKFNNKEQQEDGYNYYNKFNEGDNVKVIEKFYPDHMFIYIK